MKLSKATAVRKPPYGHVEYTRHDPKTGKTIIVQAKGAKPIKPSNYNVNPSVIREGNEYSELGEMALKNPRQAIDVIGRLTWDLKEDFFTMFPRVDKRVVSSMIDDRIRNPVIELITTAQLVSMGKRSKNEYIGVLNRTRDLLQRNIKEVVEAMKSGAIPELDRKMTEQLSMVPATKSCKNLPTIIKSTEEWGMQDTDLVNTAQWQPEARKGAEEARRRKYFLEGKTKAQREARKALEKMLKKSKNPGAEKLMDGFNVIKSLRAMTKGGQGWNRIYNKTTKRTGAITSGINVKQQKFTSRIQMTQRFKKGGRAFDRYVVERVVDGKRTTETHDFDITGSGLFTHGFEGCVREAQSKGYVPNAEQAEKLCGWILQEAGVNVARQGLALMMGREELKQYGGKAPVITRGKGGKKPMHQKGYQRKISSQVKGAGKQYLGSRPGGYSQKQFGGRVGLPPAVKGKRR